MNATPSGSCTSPAGGRDGSEARRVTLSPRDRRRASSGRRTRRSYRRRRPASPGARSAGRDVPRRCVAGPSARGSRPRKGRGHRSPARRRFISSHIRFFRRTRPLPRTRSVHDQPGGARPWRPPSRRPIVPASRPEARPTDRSSPRPGARDTELVQPALRRCDARPRALPRERSPCGMTIATLLLALLTATNPSSEWRGVRPGLARLPRRLVRPVPEDAPGHRPVDPQGLSGQVDRHRQGPGGGRRATASRPSRPSSWWTARAGSSTAPAASSPRPSWSGSTWPPRPRPSRPPSPTPMPMTRPTIRCRLRRAAGPPRAGGRGSERPRRPRR